MEEIWKDIKGFEGKYQISNFGNVKSLNYNNSKYEKNLTPKINNKGYAWYLLCKNGKAYPMLAHRLVAIAFIENPNNLPEVNHKDENPLNCNVENLEWCTRSYNTNYYLNQDPKRKEKSAKRLRDKKTGENLSPMTKKMPKKYTKRVAQKDLKGNTVNVFKNLSEVREKTEYNMGSITTACLRKRKDGKSRTAYGFIWEFLEE